MDKKIKNLGVIILPANISQEEIKQVFDAVIQKLTEENVMLDQREGFIGILNTEDLFKQSLIKATAPTPALTVLVENLLHEFGDKLEAPLAFTTSFVCEYYGPRDLINHQVVTMLASVKEGSIDWQYLSRKGLLFLVHQCRNILSNQR